MIITQTQKRRTFVGCVDDGSDLIDAIKGICVHNTILCGLFSGVGYLADVRLHRLDSAASRYTDPVIHNGTFHAIAINGNISLAERQTIVRCHTVGTLELGAGRSQLLSGELLGARVISVEFTLDTLDDIRLYRTHDPRTGLDPWRHVEFGGGPLPSPEDRPIPLLQPVPASTSPPAFASEEAPNGHDLEISPGDLLNHPTLGRCEVVATNDEERLSIRLESGRVVELHLGLLELTPIRREGTRRVFKVAIRRRR